MSKTREKGLWKWLATARAAFGTAMHLERVENAVNSGTPDVAGCLAGRHFWVELKTCDMPARPDTPVRAGVRVEQRDWHLSAYAAGSLMTYFLIQIGNERYLLIGNLAADLYSGTNIQRIRKCSLSVAGASAAEIIAICANL